MKNTLLLAALFILMQGTYARSYTATSVLHQKSNLNFIAFPQSPIVQGNAVKKKMTLKERILLKWYKKKLSRTVSEEKEKKTVKLLGNLSLGAALLAPVLFLAAFAITAYSFTLFLWVLSFILVPVAIILGSIALKKRKKLTDKTDVNRTPALIGLIIGLILLIPLLWLVIFSIAYSW